MLTQAQKELAAEHFPFALWYAGEYRWPNEDKDEIVSACCLCLVDAARCFDPTREIKFISYAGEAMRRALVRLRAKRRNRPRMSPIDPETACEVMYKGSPKDDLSEVAERLFASLDPADRAFFDTPGATFARKIGVSRQRIQQRKARLVKDLRQTAEKILAEN